MNLIYSQNIEAHTWKNRVLLVFTDDLNNPLYKNQIIELQGHENELKARKLIVYQIQKSAYKLGLSKKNDWQKSTLKQEAYKKSEAAFEILLIGLDGGIKLRETNLITCEALFSVIDVMPMRKSEMRDK